MQRLKGHQIDGTASGPIADPQGEKGVSQGNAEDDLLTTCSFGSVMEVCKVRTGPKSGSDSGKGRASMNGLSCQGNDKRETVMAATLVNAETSQPIPASEARNKTHTGGETENAAGPGVAKISEGVTKQLLQPGQISDLQQPEGKLGDESGGGQEDCTEVPSPSKFANACRDQSPNQNDSSSAHNRLASPPSLLRHDQPILAAAEKLPKMGTPGSQTEGNRGDQVHEVFKKRKSKVGGPASFETKAGVKTPQAGSAAKPRGSGSNKGPFAVASTLQKKRDAMAVAVEVPHTPNAVSTKAGQAPQEANFSTGKAQIGDKKTQRV